MHSFSENINHQNMSFSVQMIQAQTPIDQKQYITQKTEEVALAEMNQLINHQSKVEKIQSKPTIIDIILWKIIQIAINYG